MLNNQTICICSNRPHEGVYKRQAKYDPTKTTSLRNAFVVAMRKRVKTLCIAIIRKVVDGDCFGLNDQQFKITVMSFPGHKGRPGQVGGSLPRGSVGGFVEWKPSMTKEEIVKWNKNSVLKGEFFHGTSVENAEQIKKKGFSSDHHNNTTDEYGAGHYFTKYRKKAEMYASEFPGHSKVLSVFVNVKNPVTMDDWNRLDDQYNLRYLVVKGRAKEVTTILKKEGFDSVNVSYISNIFKGTEQSHQLVVFDYKNIVVLQEGSVQNNQLSTYAGEFNFARSADKVTAFMEWLKQQEKLGLLAIGTANQVGQAVEGSWTDFYIADSYERGVQRARYELIKRGYAVPALDKLAPVSATFSTPFHIDRVGLVFSRVYTELKGITNDMDKQISTILSQGLVDGKNPRDLARMLVRTITGPSGDLGITDSLGRYIPAARRAEMLARTEIIRAHHAATVQEYKNWGLEGVKVMAEWQTAGWNVCPQCSALQGRVFTIQQIEIMIPVHPNCRCCAIPVDMTEKKK